MSEEDRMERKGNSHYSVQKTNGADSKKDVSSRNQKWGKHRGNGSNNFSYNEGQNRKPTSQKYRTTWDKRPKSRGEYSTGSGGDLEEEDTGAEYGSAIQSGSKKGNLNHLLNFKYDHEVSNQSGYRGGGGGHWGRGRQVKYKSNYNKRTKVCYNKEQFLQANCQFVVKAAGDYSVQMIDPDILVSWDAVEQVRVLCSEPPSCPICLQYPIAAKMTRCGHIYCWACILHYLALGEKTWRKCPICYESIHNDDLKSVCCREVSNYKVGDEITLTLMKKEKGSIYAVPANMWQKQTNNCHNVQESEELIRHCKLVTATTDQVLQLLETEKQQLMVQQVDAESSEEPFIKGAQDQLKARELRLLGIDEINQEIKQAMQPAKEEKQHSPPTNVKAPSNKKIKQYKSAFSDEEEVESVIIQSEHNTSIESLPENTQPLEASNPMSPIESIGQENLLAEAPLSESPPQQSPCPIEMIPDIMPVEEAAEHLELPVRNRHRSGDNAFYFYQADDGQNIYLHSINARCLVREYGSLEHCPQKLTATIVDKESVFVTEELRKRLRYLSHLPLTCGFEVVELALKPPTVSKDTIKHFQEEIEKRRRQRQRRAKEDKRRARYIEEQERKKLGLGTGTIVHSQFQQQQQQHRVEQLVDTRSDASSPLFDTPVGSPKVDELHMGSSLADDGQTAAVSFAQMLKAGAKSTVWPKAKTEAEKSPIPITSSRHVGSDESDNEDKVPVPEFHSSFGSALEAAFTTIHTRKEPEAAKGGNSGGQTSGKKKKKQRVLFSTNMARGGK